MLWGEMKYQLMKEPKAYVLLQATEKIYSPPSPTYCMLEFTAGHVCPQVFVV